LKSWSRVKKQWNLPLLTAFAATIEK